MSLKQMLFASTVIPALLLAQSSATSAQIAPTSMRLAQAAPSVDLKHPGEKASAGEPTPHVPPHAQPSLAPHAEPRPAPAGHPEPSRRAEPDLGGAPTPHAETRPEPHAAPAAQALQALPEPRQERTAPAAAAPHQPPTAPAPHAETPKPHAATPNPAAEPPRRAQTPSAVQHLPTGAEPAEHSPARHATQPGHPGEASPPQTAAPALPSAKPLPGPATGTSTTYPATVAPGSATGGAGRQPHNETEHAIPSQGQPQGQAGRPSAEQNGNRGLSPGGAAAIGAAAGFAGGFLAATGAQNLEGIRHERRETVEDGRRYIREPGRTIVEDGGRSYVVHDENERFRELGYQVERQRRGDDYVDIVERPDGTQILTYTTSDGRMLRRVRRTRGGREYVLIDNGYDGHVRPVEEDVVDLPPPPINIPRDRYAVEYSDADEGLIYDTLIAPPLRAPPRRYTLDQIRYSPDIRRYVRSVDINTINFDTGSWQVPVAASGKLRALADAIKRAISKDPNAVFLVEGFTDATGNPTDNLSLSDRRAQSVAAILSKEFGVPPENLTTQGYGQQNLKEDTNGPSAANRRVVVQNITPLLAAGGEQPR